MEEQKVIAKISEPIVYESLIRPADEAEEVEAETLSFIDIDIHQL
jgi:hypothetical protein